MKKSFVIPALSVVSVSVSGCADPIIGDWDMSKLGDDEFPYHYEGEACTYDGTGLLSIIDDLTGSFTFEYSADCGSFGELSISYTWTAAVTVVEKKASYTIALTGEDEDIADLDLDCTMTDKAILDCEDSDGEEIDFALAVEE